MGDAKYAFISGIIFTGLECIFLAVWTGVDAVGKDFHQEEENIYYYCNSTSPAFYILQITFIGLGLLFGLILVCLVSLNRKLHEATYIFFYLSCIDSTCCSC